MSTVRYEKELAEYRNLMEVPSTFEEGFTWSSVAGAVFIALLMVPGAMYMQLLAGMGVGPSAQWVTVILFIEVARRAHKVLHRSEIFILFYMAGAVMAAGTAAGARGGPTQILNHQFFAQSQAATGMGVVETIPVWYAPTDTAVLAQRNFFDPVWYPALGLMIFQMVMGRLNIMFMSYGLFRLASDVEKLPFPMAFIGAQGVTALAEQQSEERGKVEDSEANWRWRVFSIGGALGLSFGALYMGLPAITNAVLDKPIIILPIPFVDLTRNVSGILPAAPVAISLNMAQLVMGMVLPFFAIVGSFLGLVLKIVANPLMYKFGILTSWDTNDTLIPTVFKNMVDFYFSFSLGIAIAIAIAGIYQVVRGVRRRAKLARKQRRLRIETETSAITPPGRGDMPTPLAVGGYLCTSLAYVLLSGWLINWHPTVMVVLFFYAFLYTPILNFVTARMEGIAGQVLQIPLVREAAFILSGYRGGVDIWFLPLPLENLGKRTVFYRQAELTGTKFWSIWKAELVMIPMILVSSIFFSQFIWSLAPVPSQQYPYADKMWELQAANRCIMYTATLGRFSKFEEAFRVDYLAYGAGFGIALFAIMAMLNLPMMLMYGMFRGINQVLPGIIPTQFIGAIIGRFYFERKMGLKWRQYIPVVAAGFVCGMGLITVFAVGVNFLSRAVVKVPF